MNILIFNLAIDSKDSALSFTTDWINEIAKNYENVFVITLRGDLKNISKNVKPFKLYKKNKNKLLAIIRFYVYLIKILANHKINRCFSHMNPLFLGLTLGLLKILKIKTILWYTHPSITLKLRIATFLTDKVVSASQFSFPIKTNKLIPIGHGIDSTRFIQSFENKQIKYISVVGRISEVKNIHLIIRAYSKLNHKKYKLVIIGDTITLEDNNYKEKLIKIIFKKNLQNLVEFKDSLNRDKLSKVYNDSLCLINATKFGSFDKVVLEAMICGTPTLSHNIAFKDLYIPYEKYCIFKYNDEIDLSEKLGKLIEIESKKLIKIKKTLYNNTITSHSLATINSRLESVFKII